MITIKSHNVDGYKAENGVPQLTWKYEQITRAHINQIDLEINQTQLLEMKNIILQIAELMVWAE